MKRVTRNIGPDSARDLLERVPRACIAFEGQNGPCSQPIALVWRDRRYFVGIPQNADQRPSPGQEIVLLVDEGVHFFDLRAIYIRCRVQPAQPPGNAPASHTWIEAIPVKTVAWDYGMLREVNDDR